MCLISSVLSNMLLLQAKSQFKRRSTANNVEIVIPVPQDADSPKFKTTVGSCKYAPEISSVIWTIKSFPVSIHFYILHKSSPISECTAHV